jgi:hypothetical protein
MLSINQRFGKHCSCHLQGLKMATAIFAEMLTNAQHSMWLTPKRQSYTLNSNWVLSLVQINP